MKANEGLTTRSLFVTLFFMSTLGSGCGSDFEVAKVLANAGKPYTSCRALYLSGDATEDGYYRIDVNKNGKIKDAENNVECDKCHDGYTGITPLADYEVLNGTLNSSSYNKRENFNLFVGQTTDLDFLESPFGFHPALPDAYAEDLGLHWTRGLLTPYFCWSLVDPQKTGNPNNFRWSGNAPSRRGRNFFFDYDSLFSANLKSFHLLCNFDITTQGDYHNQDSWIPSDETAYRSFVKATVQRYPFINYWQVGNEPNFKAGAFSDFGELQRITYEAIKETNPKAQVLIAGLGGNSTVDSLNSDYYDSVLKSLNGKYIDIFDVHFYGDAKGGALTPGGDPKDRFLGYREFRKVYSYYRNLLDKNGYTNVPIWVTEMGTFSGLIKVRRGDEVFILEQTEAEQAIEVVKRWVYPLSLGVKKVFWAYGLVEGFGQWDDDFFDHTGFIYDGRDGVHKFGEKKLAYYTFKKMIEILEGSDLNSIRTLQEKNGVYVYKFTKQGKSIWVTWNDNKERRKVTISKIKSKKVRVTEAVPRYDTGYEVEAYDSAFRTRETSIKAKRISLKLKSTPTFIEEE